MNRYGRVSRLLSDASIEGVSFEYYIMDFVIGILFDVYHSMCNRTILNYLLNKKYSDLMFHLFRGPSVAQSSIFMEPEF